MPTAEEILEETLTGVKALTPKQRQDLLPLLLTDVKEIKKPVGLRMAAQRAEIAQYKPVALTFLSSVGGAIAEPVRRNLVGRLVSPCAQQGLALIIIGGGVQYLGSNKRMQVPILGPLGAAHCSYGGALVAISLYGTEAKPDPVKLALEGTTYKALHPKADAKK